VLFLYWIHFAFPLVVDTCVLQPPIATSGETASASQEFPKGPVVRACWCVVRAEPWVCPCVNKDQLSTVEIHQADQINNHWVIGIIELHEV
jgi:hypothetical protein